jgi:putative membrane protein
VRLAAEAAFYRDGVGHTRERTGVVVFISLLERRVEVVADAGILRQRPIKPWDAAVAALQGALTRGGDVEAVTAALRQLGDVLALCLPWRDGINEIENDVREGE